MLAIGDQIRVLPKTNNAKRAVSSGLGSLVVIVDITDACQALKGTPAAYQVAPRGNPVSTSPHARWIAQERDQHFRIATL